MQCVVDLTVSCSFQILNLQAKNLSWTYISNVRFLEPVSAIPTTQTSFPLVYYELTPGFITEKSIPSLL